MKTRMRTTKDWKLPKPPDVNYPDWQPVVRLSKDVPWGYERDPNDPLILLPIPRELNQLERGKAFLGQFSLKEVSEWLSTQTGRYISARGLKARIDLEEKNRRRGRTYSLYAKKAAEAARRAKELEMRLGGERAKGYVHYCPCCGKAE